MATQTTRPPETRITAGAVTRKRARKETLIRFFVTANGAVAMIAVALIMLFLLKDAIPTFRYVSVTEFLLGRNWYPLDEIFGILAIILGSLLVTAVAILIALPVSLGCAIYIAEIAPRSVREILKPTVEILAGIPSIVIGFIGLVILSPLVKELFSLDSGLTALTGAITLAFMAMPTIISISEDAIVAVPSEYRDASLALGATHWQTISGALVPAAKSGITAAVMLGVGRAIGETMAVMMVTGNALHLPPKLFDSVRTLTATIATEMGEAVQGSAHYHALFAMGLVLFAITFAVNLAADVALRRSRR
ncbi:MAG: phosphate ABC transporter permease subunit PstC [Armatimonadota bacterium]|nr:phosphate ABC transporter permease subunit PstC [Armatimonadota bacterium]